MSTGNAGSWWTGKHPVPQEEVANTSGLLVLSVCISHSLRLKVQMWVLICNFLMFSTLFRPTKTRSPVKKMSGSFTHWTGENQHHLCPVPHFYFLSSKMKLQNRFSFLFQGSIIELQLQLSDLGWILTLPITRHVSQGRIINVSEPRIFPPRGGRGGCLKNLGLGLLWGCMRHQATSPRLKIKETLRTH